MRLHTCGHGKHADLPHNCKRKQALTTGSNCHQASLLQVLDCTWQTIALTCCSWLTLIAVAFRAPDNPPVDQQGSLQHGTGRHVQATGSAAPDLHEDAACAYAHAADGRWRTGPCGPSVNLETVTACRQAEGRPAASATRFQGHSIRQPVQPPFWVLAPLSDCASTSCCPAGYIFDVPHSAVENLLLKQAMEAMGVDRALLALKPPTYYPPWLSPASTPATPAS